MMTIDDIIHDYNNGVYTPEKVVIPNKYPADYVFDENMSVKWNRECVLSENSKIDDMRKKAADEENRLCKLLRRQVIDYIALSLAEYDKNDLTKGYIEIATKFEARLFEDYHYNMYTYLEKVDSCLEYAYIVMEMYV